jgi:hypothetical protein
LTVEQGSSSNHSSFIDFRHKYASKEKLVWMQYFNRNQ